MDVQFFKKEKIDAMKSGNREAVTALNSVINKLMLLTIEKRAKGADLNNDDVVQILKKVEKEITEERDAFEKAGRADNVSALNAQIGVINKYLPKLMSEEEIAEVIKALPDKSVPFVMKHFKANFGGTCDMKTVSKVLKELSL